MTAITRSGALRNVQQYIQLPLLKNHWYVAGMIEEFGREPTAKLLLEESVVFYRTEAGTLTALQNRCLHRSYPLAEGRVRGDNLVCGYHGVEYSPAGSIEKVPCQDMCPKKKLRKYPTREIGPFALIWMGGEENIDESRLPDLSFLEDPEYRTIQGVKHLEGNYLLLHENLADLSHLAFLHAKTFGAPEEFAGVKMDVELRKNGTVGENGIAAYRTEKGGEVLEGFYPPDLQAELSTYDLSYKAGGVTHTPGIYRGHGEVTIHDAKPGMKSKYTEYIMHYVTPATKNTAHYYYSVSRDYGQDNEEFVQGFAAVAAVAFEEDLVAVRHMQKLLEQDKNDYQEMVFAADQAGVLVRKMMLDWVEEEYPGSL